MGEFSKIEWTHHTFNPWVGCQRVSPGCEHCYAEAQDNRWHDGKHWGVKGERQVTSDAYWKQPLRWNRAIDVARVIDGLFRFLLGDAPAIIAAPAFRHRVFCASLADVFEDRPELAAPRARLHRLIEETPNLDWLLLTKRPQNAQRLMAIAAFDANDRPAIARVWPPNLWLGVTAENQEYADERIPTMLAIHGPALFFVSYEPALGPVNFTRIGEDECGVTYDALRGILSANKDTGGPRVSWIIVGGESGRGARAFDVGWARSTIQQCKAAGVACFVKQYGASPIGSCTRCNGSGIDPVRIGHDPEWCSECGGASQGGPLPITLRSKKGGDMAEWPEAFRVRELPR